jgi:WD40 repeat protein
MAAVLLLGLLPACVVGPDRDEPTPTTQRSPTSFVSGTATPENDQPLLLIGHQGPVSFVAWSPDGTLLATAADGSSGDDAAARIWNSDGILAAELDGQQAGVTCLSWSADSRSLAIGSTDGVVRIWSRDGTLESAITLSDDEPPASVTAIAWSPVEALLATGIIHPKEPAELANHPTQPATIQLWQPDGTEVRTFAIEHTFDGTLLLSWSDDGSRLAAGGNDLHIWDTSGNELYAVSGGEFDFHPSMAFSADGTLLAYSDVTGTLHIQPDDGRPPVSAGGFGLDRSVTFSPDSGMIAIATDTLLLIVGVDDPVGTRVQALANGVQSAPAWSPDSRLLAVGVARRSVQIVGIDGRSVAILSGCEGMVERVAWSPDGVQLAAGFFDGQVCLWNVDGL